MREADFYPKKYSQFQKDLFVDILNSPKKRSKKFYLRSFFWENWRHQKVLSKLTDLYS